MTLKNYMAHYKDIIEAGAAGLGYTALNLTDIDLVVKIVAGLLTSAYMVYKWRKEIKAK